VPASAKRPSDDAYWKVREERAPHTRARSAPPGFSSRRVPVRDDAYWKVREERAGARLGEKTKGRYGGWE
jgi:hypothetical protein